MSNDQVELMDGAPPFYEGLHRKYITELADKLDQSFEGAIMDRTSRKSAFLVCHSCVRERLL